MWSTKVTFQWYGMPTVDHIAKAARLRWALWLHQHHVIIGQCLSCNILLEMIVYIIISLLLEILNWEQFAIPLCFCAHKNMKGDLLNTTFHPWHLQLIWISQRSVYHVLYWISILMNFASKDKLSVTITQLSCNINNIITWYVSRACQRRQIILYLPNFPTGE